MKHVMKAVAAIACALIVTACATSGAGAKAEREPQYAEVRISKVLRAETAYPDGMISSIVASKYDEKGDQISEETYSGAKKLVSRKTFAASGDGKVTVVTYGDDGEIIGKATRTERDGSLISEIQASPKGEFQSSEEYEYDAKGNKTRWTVKTASGSVVITAYAYDNGRPSTIIVTDGVGAIVKKFVKVYPEIKPTADQVASPQAGKAKQKNDAKAKEAEAKAALAAFANAMPLAEEEYDGTGTLVSKTLFTWDGRYLAREEKKNAFNATLSSTTYKNDGDGNPVEIAYADRNGRVIEIKRKEWATYKRRVAIR